MVSLGRMQQAVVTARKRYWRIKLQQAMKWYKTPQMLRFVGDDGAYKQEWFTGIDFAQVGAVDMQAGTGTMMPPQEKVQYVAQMAQMNFMGREEAADAARPTFSQTLGIPADPQQQRIERQVSTFLQGPPKGWMEKAQQFDLAAQQAQAQTPPPQPGQAPTPPATPPGPPLWTPFAPLPPDDEPEVAIVRLRRLRRLLGTVRFSSQVARWQQTATAEYSRMRQAVAQAAQAQAMAEQNKLIAVEQAKGQAAVQLETVRGKTQMQLEQTRTGALLQQHQEKLSADQGQLTQEQVFELRKIELEAALAMNAQGAADLEAREVAREASAMVQNQSAQDPVEALDQQQQGHVRGLTGVRDGRSAPTRPRTRRRPRLMADWIQAMHMKKGRSTGNSACRRGRKSRPRRSRKPSTRRTRPKPNGRGSR